MPLNKRVCSSVGWSIFHRMHRWSYGPCCQVPRFALGPSIYSGPLNLQSSGAPTRLGPLEFVFASDYGPAWNGKKDLFFAFEDDRAEVISGGCSLFRISG